MENKSANPKLGRDQIPKDLECSSSTLQRYGNFIFTLSPYKFPPNSHKRRQNTSNEYLKRFQITSIDIERPRLTSKVPTNEIVVDSTNKPFKKKKNTMKRGASQGGNIEIDDECLKKLKYSGSEY